MTKSSPLAGSSEFTHPVRIRGLIPGMVKVGSPVKQYPVIENYTNFNKHFRLTLSKVPYIKAFQ